MSENLTHNRRYYQGPWFTEPFEDDVAQVMCAYRCHPEGIDSEDYWRIPRTNSLQHQKIQQQYDDGWLLIKKTVYIRLDDHANPDNWTN